MGTIFFIFSLSLLFPTEFGSKRCYDGVFWFFEFFLLFFGIFYYGSGRYQSRIFFLFSLFLALFLPILAWKEALLVFPNFLNFFAIYFGIFYYGSSMNTSERFFFFLSFSAFPNLFWLGKKLWWCFLIFWIFSLFF